VTFAIGFTPKVVGVLIRSFSRRFRPLKG